MAARRAPDVELTTVAPHGARSPGCDETSSSCASHRAAAASSARVPSLTNSRSTARARAKARRDPSARPPHRAGAVPSCSARGRAAQWTASLLPHGASKSPLSHKPHCSRRAHSPYRNKNPPLAPGPRYGTILPSDGGGKCAVSTRVSVSQWRSRKLRRVRRARSASRSQTGLHSGCGHCTGLCIRSPHMAARRTPDFRLTTTWPSVCPSAGSSQSCGTH